MRKIKHWALGIAMPKMYENFGLKYFYILIFLAIASPNILNSQACIGDQYIIDFDLKADGTAFENGEIISDQYDAWGVTFSSRLANGTINTANPLVIFDSSDPDFGVGFSGDASNGDCDLGTPGFLCSTNTTDTSDNCDGAYPGESNNGGGSNNCTSLGKLLIIEEHFVDNYINSTIGTTNVLGSDGLDDSPDDLGSGGTVRMEFNNPYNLTKIGFVDDASGDFILTFSDNSTQSIAFDGGLDNDTLLVDVNFLDVIQIDVDFNSSGAISLLELCDLQTGDIGDQLWQDLDNDGVFNAAIDSVIADVNVILTFPSGIKDTAVTDANGQYLFTDLAPGKYDVTVDTADPDFPAGVTNSVDPDTGNDNTSTTTLTTAVPDDLDQDFGYKGAGSIGDQLYVDLDNDGAFDPAVDSVIANVTVTLTLPSGETLTTVTDVNGEYTFTDLAPGDYTVTVDTNDADFPAGVTNSVDPDTGNDNTSDVTLTSAAPSNLDQDFGYKGAGSIGDQLFIDVNGDGVYTQGTDTPIVDVNVILTLPNGAKDTIVTDVNGQYTFENLPPAVYTITVDVADVDFPEDVINTVDPDGTEDNSSDITLTLANPSTDIIDFGYVVPVSLGDLVWLDADADGIKDVGENGINGIKVNLYDGDGTFIADTVTFTNLGTGNDGYYVFEDLLPGTYYVEFETGTSTFSPADQGMNDTADSDITGANGLGTTDDIVITSGNDNFDVDAGIFNTANIGDVIFHDLNGDGLRKNGEPGINGLEVALVNTNGDTIATDITSNGGMYLFENVGPGDYEVRFSAPTDFVFTGQNVGTDEVIDSDVDSDGTTGLFTFNPENGNNLNIDAGVFNPVSLGDLVWDDIDGDGIKDELENGIANVTVTLYDDMDNQVGLSTTTDALGLYRFENLTPGVYYVEFAYPAGYVTSPSDQGGDDADDSDVTGTNGINTTDEITLVSGMDNLDIDAGIYQAGSIGNFVFFDDDHDGIFNNTDYAIADINVYLINSVGDTIDMTSTDVNGEYLFSDLPGGSYTIGFDIPEGHASTIPNNGDGTNDCDIINGDGTTAAFTLLAGENRDDIDAGFALITVPIEMLYFEGKVRKDDNVLSWATSLEINNDYFEIQRLLEGESDFETIGRVLGNGSTTDNKLYEFIDRDSKEAGVYYYRLKQVDFNSTFEYSEVISLVRSGDRVEISLFPNPTQDFINVNLLSSLESDAIIEIYSMDGRLMKSSILSMGTDFIQIELTTFSSGNYIIKILNDKVQFQELIIKTK